MRWESNCSSSLLSLSERQINGNRLSSPRRWRYGCGVVFFCAAMVIALPAQVFNTLATLNGTDGSEPIATLVQGTDGNLYGTATLGGAYGEGTIFKISRAGTITTLHSFCAQVDCPDGREPRGPLIQASDGNFYGTANFGGVDNNYGTVFRIAPTGTFTTIHSFCSQTGCPDGSYVYSGLVQGTDGYLYGTTNEGGDLTCFAPYGCGTIFRISTTGQITTLHRFHTGEGNFPFAGLVQGVNGNFYRTTGFGGDQGLGTVFTITPRGALTTLYSFCSVGSCFDGALPYAPLIQATDGDLFGTTEEGGSNGNWGTVFKISPAGAFTSLHAFDINDGNDPNDGLVQGSDGKFYGTTQAGGDSNIGTVFEISSTGALVTLHSFCTICGDGGYPSPLVQDTDGKFYGTTQTDTTSNNGTVFSIGVGLGPFVETRPNSGKVGTKVIILGTNLSGATSVSFNGTAATFTVVSSSEITTTVPGGAKTGLVQTTLPNRLLSTKVPFRVTN
jgi:uncharacterized repeat protein (TIGR03803 family)